MLHINDIAALLVCSPAPSPVPQVALSACFDAYVQSHSRHYSLSAFFVDRLDRTAALYYAAISLYA